MAPQAIVGATPEVVDNTAPSRIPLWARIVVLLVVLGGVGFATPYSAFIAIIAIHGWDSAGFAGSDPSIGTLIFWYVLVLGGAWLVLAVPTVLAARWVTHRHKPRATVLAFLYSPAIVGIILLALWTLEN